MQDIERIHNQVLDKGAVVPNSREDRGEECGDIRGRGAREGRKFMGGCRVQMRAVNNT